MLIRTISGLNRSLAVGSSSVRIAANGSCRRMAVAENRAIKNRHFKFEQGSSPLGSILNQVGREA